jgi:hypothetical protein
MPCNRHKLAAAIARFGRMRLSANPGCESRLYPVHLELWKIGSGAVQIGDFTQHEWFERFGALVGSAFGATRQWRTTLGALSRASIREFDIYSELVLTVPGVIVEDDERQLPRAFVLGMITDSSIARLADIALGFGYQKEFGRFRQDDGGGWSVATSRGMPLLSIVTRADCRVEDGFTPTAIEAIFRQPFLGFSEGRGLVQSRVQRSLFQPDTRFRPVAASAELLGDCFSELFAQHHELPPYRSDVPWGALQFWNIEAVVSYPYRV